MRMDRQADIGCIGTHLDGKSDFADELTGIRTDDAAADHSVSVWIEEQLGESLVATLCE
jgi:hypothetical protein